MSTSFSARTAAGYGDHVTVSVFAGPDADHRAHVGTLIMRASEADALVALFEKAEAERLHQQALDALDDAMRPWVEKGAPATESENGYVSDGYASWPRCAPDGVCTLEVVRPGKVQCIDLLSALNGVTEAHCDALGMERP